MPDIQGTTESELAETISDPAMKQQVDEVFRKVLVPADAIARAIAFAIGQPADVDVNELVVRPTAQSFWVERSLARCHGAFTNLRDAALRLVSAGAGRYPA